MAKLGRFFASLLIVAIIAALCWFLGVQLGILKPVTKEVVQNQKNVTVTALLLNDNGSYLLVGDTNYPSALSVVNSVDERIKQKLDANVNRKVTASGALFPASSTNFYLFQLNGETLASDASIGEEITSTQAPTLHEFLSTATDVQRQCVLKAIPAAKFDTLDPQSISQISIDDMKTVSTCLSGSAQ